MAAEDHSAGCAELRSREAHIREAKAGLHTNNSHRPLSKGRNAIYFGVLMCGLSLIPAAKQTLGLNLRVSVMRACASPTLETRARVMRLERLTKTNL